MKAIMIIYNQALTEKVEYMINKLQISGYSKWEEVHGRGTFNGQPHLGTHTWPETNSSMLTIVDDEKVTELLDNIKKLDSFNKEVGIRAFVWDILQTV